MLTVNIFRVQSKAIVADYASINAGAKVAQCSNFWSTEISTKRE
jgi:hypothetical protein